MRYIPTNVEVEYLEGIRYPEVAEGGMTYWASLMALGQVVKWSTLGVVENVDLDLPSLHPLKLQRAGDVVRSGVVERPLVGEWSDGYRELMGGNTRLAHLLAMGLDPEVTLVRLARHV